MHIDSNGEMERCFQDNGFQDQVHLPPFPHKQQGYFEEGSRFSYHPYLFSFVHSQ
jgi:hypothetical protein